MEELEIDQIACRMMQLLTPVLEDMFRQMNQHKVVKESYTIDEVAKRLGRSEWTVRQWCNKGQVPDSVKVPGKGRTGEWRIPHEAVTRLESQGPLPLAMPC